MIRVVTGLCPVREDREPLSRQVCVEAHDFSRALIVESPADSGGLSPSNVLAPCLPPVLPPFTRFRKLPMRVRRRHFASLPVSTLYVWPKPCITKNRRAERKNARPEPKPNFDITSSSRSDSYGNAYQNLSTISFDDDVLDAGRLFAGTRWHRPESDTILIVSPEFESKLCTELRPKLGSEFGSRFRSKFRLFRTRFLR